MEVVVSVELFGMMKIPLKINNFQTLLSARMELLEFSDIIPCFNNTSISLLKRPLLDFSFHFGILELTNVGIGKYNLSNFVKLMSKILCEQILYPKVFTHISRNNSINVARYPEGLLRINLLGANNLMIKDISTDPFVVVKVGNKSRFSSVDICDGRDWKEVENAVIKVKNSNPMCCEEFDVLVYEKLSEKLQVCILDHDTALGKVELGHIIMDLCQIPMKRSIEVVTNLIHGSGGKIKLKYIYLPLLRSLRSQGIVNDDETFLIDLPSAIQFLDLESSRTNVVRTSVDLFDNDKQITSYIEIGNNETWRDIGDQSDNLHFIYASTGVLVINSVRCKNLRASPSFLDLLMPSTMKVSVKFEVGGVTHTTRVVADKHDPNFPGEFSFIVIDVNYSKLSVAVIDGAETFSEREVGSLVLNTKDFAHGGNVESEYLLESKYEESFITFRGSWYATY